MDALAAGELPPDQSDPDEIGCFALAPELLAQQVTHAIDQPWGVSIGDITVRSSGERYILWRRGSDRPWVSGRSPLRGAAGSRTRVRRGVRTA